MLPWLRRRRAPQAVTVHIRLDGRKVGFDRATADEVAAYALKMAAAPRHHSARRR